MSYLPAADRYDVLPYRRCGRSGLLLPAISLGLWHNFGDDRPFATQRAICRRAFDLGVTHFDLANNYGPPYGAAEANFGRMLATDFAAHRDELVISTKAGYDMWPGPYGDRGSRKYLLASLDQSLARLGLDYVDIFYSHRVDPDTPLDETMGALVTAVEQGKALYAGISSYSSARTVEAAALLAEHGRSAADPPALVLDVQPLDRARRPARHARSCRRRLHRVLAARPGPAHRSLPARDPRGLAGGHRWCPCPRHGHRGAPGPRPGARRDRRRAGPDAGAARPRLGAARPAHDLARDRRQQRGPARGQPRRRRNASTSPPTSWRRSTSTPSMPASTSGRRPATAERDRPRPVATSGGRLRTCTGHVV